MYNFVICNFKGFYLTIKLGEISNIRTGLVTARKKAKADSLNKFEYKQISLKSFGKGIKLQKDKSDIFISAQEIAPKYFTKEGDVIVRLRAPASAVYIDKNDEGLLIHSLLVVIRADKDKLDPKYLAYYINSKPVQRILKQDVKGTAIPMLKTKDLEELPIILPPLQKQKKLVGFLELVDKEAELLQLLANEKLQFSEVVFIKAINQYKEN